MPRDKLVERETGNFRDLGHQKELFENLGLQFDATTQETKVILYCNGGFAACVPALGLQRLGFRNWAIYDASWNEWGNVHGDEWPVES